MDKEKKQGIPAPQGHRGLEQSLDAILRSLGHALIVTDRQGFITQMNPLAETLTGWTRAKGMGKYVSTILRLWDERNFDLVSYPLAIVIEEASPLALPHHVLLSARDGTEIPVDVKITPIQEPDGTISGAAYIFQDITLYKNAEELLYSSEPAFAGYVNFKSRVKRNDDSVIAELPIPAVKNYRNNNGERQLLYDDLTKLPNRSLFIEFLEHSVKRAKVNQEHIFALLLLDLDRFKVLNDSLGHTVGDRLLIEITRRLEHCLRPSDIMARLSGDEFAILLDDIEDINDAIRLAEHTQKELSTPFHFDGHDIFTSASIGIALSSNSYDLADHILRDADTAMHRAKKLGKARHVIFDKAMHVRTMALLQLETDLRRAVDRQEFCLYYWPTVSLQTGQLQGFEALIRWIHPRRGLIYPGEFIPLAEETGLIIPMGDWVMREACRQMLKWQQEFPRESPLDISVNVSVKQLSNPQFIDQIRQILLETGLDPACLKLEITESMLMEGTEKVITVFKQLKDMGIQLHMDDFGTGYSSLSYLHRFPLDTLKIDSSFVSSMETNPKNAEIVSSVLNLARNLGMDVIAEGVKTLTQVEHLRSWGCEFAQGSFFAAPLSCENAVELLRSRTSW